MRILVTGASGFVARHFLAMLNEHCKGCEVLGIYHSNYPNFDAANDFPDIKLHLAQINIIDKSLLSDALIDFYPDRVLHLAAKSSVATSWKKPADTIIENTTMFLNLIEVVRETPINPRILSIGSSEEYGKVFNNPVKLVETFPSNPNNPYGTSRVVQRKMVEMYHKVFGLDILHTRSFNHFGAYQNDEFVLSSFAKQLAKQEIAEKKVLQLSVGNASIIRDFTDVGDVVLAYQSLFEKGKVGEVYNVCSGTGHSLQTLIGYFSEICNKEIIVTKNPDFYRPADNIELVGDNSKIMKDTFWKPKIPIKTGLKNLLDYWVATLSKNLIESPFVEND